MAQTNGDFYIANENIQEELQDKTVYISFFHGEGCPHCAKEASFLEKISKEYDNLDFKIFEIYNNKENAQLLIRVGKALGKSTSGVPFTVIGDQVVYGYLNDQTTGAQIRSIIEKQTNDGSRDIVGEIMESSNLNSEKKSEQGGVKNQDDYITLPVFGEVNIKTFSLPALTILIAAVDGFNPCAMWVLLFLISLLLGMEDKKKMWTLGVAFIATSAIVYFLFLSAWLNLFLFLGFIASVRIGVGLVAIGSGAFHLKEWWSNRSGACKVTNVEQKKKIMDKLREIASQKYFIFALFGIIGLAFAVNLVELVCSAGLPAIYTNILSISNLSTYQYYLFLLLYIFIFMLDDLLIFIIAMTTLRATGISSKYSRWSGLIGGIVILAIGILLIFKPGWVMFG